MFVIVWRRSGIALLIYLFLSGWIVSYWFEDTTLGNASYMGWVLFYTAIATSLHALALVALKNAPPDPQDPNDPDPDATPPAPIWHHSLFFIPVVIWPLIFGGISAKCLIGGGSDDAPAEVAATVPDEPVVEKRTIYLLNPTEDRMIYVISGSGDVFEKDTIEGLTYIERRCEPGMYLISGLNIEGEIIFSFPIDEISNDPEKCKKAKNGDLMLFHRIIREGTPSEKDCDDIWVMLNGARDMMLVDVTAICSDTVTQADIEKMDWTPHLVRTFDGRDIIEPLYGKNPGKETYTVLPVGEKIPTSLGKNERIFTMFSIDRDEKLTSEYIAERMLNRCDDRPEK